MEVRVGFLRYLWVTSILIQVNGAIPQGLWKVVGDTVEKNTDGKVEKNVYATVAEVKSPIPYPQEWYVMHVPQGILLRYADGSENLYRYDIEDNRLIISIDENTTQSYRYEVNGEELILTPVYEKSEKNVEHEGEHQIIILKKQGYNIKN